jgi:hypothetical protein
VRFSLERWLSLPIIIPPSASLTILFSNAVGLPTDIVVKKPTQNKNYSEENERISLRAKV